MRTLFLISAFAFIAPLMTFGQGKAKPSFQFTDLSISTGVETYFSNSTDYGFLLEGGSGSELIPSNLDLYKQQNYHYIYGSGSYEIMAGFAWRSSEEDGAKVNKRLRIGISYSQPSLLGDGYYRYETNPFDTLRSAQTGAEYYVDSIYSSNIGLNYDVNKVRLNTSLIWTTDDDARFAFYGGVNLSLSLNFGSRINVHRTEFSYLTYNDRSQPYYGDQFGNLDSDQESYKQASSFGFGFSSPIGIDWRMGKQGKSLNDVHLFSEVRPGVAFNNVPGYETLGQFSASFHFGLRFSM